MKTVVNQMPVASSNAPPFGNSECAELYRRFVQALEPSYRFSCCSGEELPDVVCRMIKATLYRASIRSRFWGFLRSSPERLLTKYPRYFDARATSPAVKKIAHDPSKFAQALSVHVDQHAARNKAALLEAGGSGFILALHDLEVRPVMCLLVVVLLAFSFARVFGVGLSVRRRMPA